MYIYILVLPCTNVYRALCLCCKRCYCGRWCRFSHLFFPKWNWKIVNVCAFETENWEIEREFSSRSLIKWRVCLIIRCTCCVRRMCINSNTHTCMYLVYNIGALNSISLSHTLTQIDREGEKESEWKTSVLRKINPVHLGIRCRYPVVLCSTLFSVLFFYFYSRIIHSSLYRRYSWLLVVK